MLILWGPEEPAMKNQSMETRLRHYCCSLFSGCEEIVINSSVISFTATYSFNKLIQQFVAGTNGEKLGYTNIQVFVDFFYFFFQTQEGNQENRVNPIYFQKMYSTSPFLFPKNI